jgi:hypothetical protein
MANESKEMGCGGTVEARGGIMGAGAAHGQELLHIELRPDTEWRDAANKLSEFALDAADYLSLSLRMLPIHYFARRHPVVVT